MKIVMNETRKAVIATLKASNEPLTLDEISKAVGFEVKTGSTNALVKAGVMVVAGTKTVACTRKTTVNTYVYVGEPTKDTKTVMNDTRKNLLEVLKNAEAPMTLNDIAKALEVESIGSGVTNPMVKSNLIKVAGEVKVDKAGTREVNAYVLGNVNVA